VNNTDTRTGVVVGVESHANEWGWRHRDQAAQCSAC